MAVVDIIDILRAKQSTPMEFEYDALMIPPMQYYLSPQDVEQLRQIATSIKLSSKIDIKYQMIDNIMRYRGFKRFSAGTNRIVYRFLEDDRFVVKIAVDKVGMQDNPKEYQNQFLLKPYVAKMFYTSPCGTVGFAEKVLPIKNKEEFRRIAPDVFEILINKILGKYVVDDIGTKYFMNYGIRKFVSPVLLDYPYVYKLDGNKLFCNKQDIVTGLYCGGEIDYDAGFNNLVCQRCGKIYLARDLRDDSTDNTIVIKGGNSMKVSIVKGNETVYTTIESNEFMEKPKKKKFDTGYKISAKIVGYNEPSIKPGSSISVEDNREKVPPLNVVIKVTDDENKEVKKEENTQADNPIKTIDESRYEYTPIDIDPPSEAELNNPDKEEYYYEGPSDDDDEEDYEDSEEEEEVEETKPVSNELEEKEENSVEENSTVIRSPRVTITNNRIHGGPRVGSTFIPKR